MARHDAGGLGLGMILVLLVLFSGLEPVLFRIHPLLSFVGMFSLVISLPILMVVLVPRLLRKRISQTSHFTIQAIKKAIKKDILRIEIRKPGRITEKGYFTVRLLNGTSFSFWTVGQDMFDYVNSLLTSFAPEQITDASISPAQFTDRASDGHSNRWIVGIFVFLILLIVTGVGVLSPYVTLAQLIEYILGVILVHTIIISGYVLLRRSRRNLRRRP